MHFSCAQCSMPEVHWGGDMRKLDHVIIISPPGTGKTMWARRQAQRWPFPQQESASDRTYTYRVTGMDLPADRQQRGCLIDRPPFRAPHHTVSSVAMIGQFTKGYQWRPGELSLAHGGTLFVDEAPEFRRDTLEHIIHAATTGSIRLSGMFGTATEVPAQFRMIAACNPCPCGWYGHETKGHKCACTDAQIIRYMKRIENLLKICRLIPAAEWRVELDDMVAKEKDSHAHTQTT